MPIIVTPRHNSPEFKEKCVRLVLEEGRTVAEVAKDMQVGRNTLHGWVHQAKVMSEAVNRAVEAAVAEALRAEREESDARAAADRAEIVRLQAELAAAREELAKLKGKG